MQKNSIQFFGLPGSGKTSILNALAEAFPSSYERVPKFTKTERLGLALRFVLRFPMIGIKFLSLITRNDPRLWGYVAHLISQSFACHMYAIKHQRNNKYFLIDEGVFQRLLSVAPRRFTEREARRLTASLAKLSSRVVLTRGGDFGRFVFEPDRMTSYRNRLGPKYFKKWSEDLVGNFSMISKVIPGTVPAEKGGPVEDLHSKLEA